MRLIDIRDFAADGLRVLLRELLQPVEVVLDPAVTFDERRQVSGLLLDRCPSERRHRERPDDLCEPLAEFEQPLGPHWWFLGPRASSMEVRIRWSA
ncbi:MAG: hypothetical protein ACJ72L_11665 [Marmoricola sp.]